MASVADVFAHIYTTENELNSVAVKNGQIILCTDSGKLYIDHVSTRIGISDIIQVENYDALPLAPLDKFYLTRDNGKIYIYVNDRWSLISLDTDINDAVLRYPATVDSESGVVVITDGTPVTDVRIGDEIVTSDGVYKKVKDSVTIDQGSTTTITDTLDLFEYASLTPDVVKSVNGVIPDDKGLVTLPDATTEVSGLLSAADKTKLDSLSTEIPEMSVTVGAGLSGKGTSDTPLTLNLSSYQTNTSISLTSTAGAVQMISNTSESALYSSNAFVKANLDIIEMKGNHLKFNSNDENTAGGLLVIGADGKIPTSLYDATIDLSDYQTNGPIKLTTTSNAGDGSGDITITTSENIILKGGDYDKIEMGNSTMHITSEASVLINGQTGFTIQRNGVDVISESSGYLTIADNNINLNGTLRYNGASVNTSNGLVQLDGTGKILASQLPEMTQSWTKVTINQSNFSTDDNTYGGKYMELDGICSVEVYDADGYKVEFDVKCDFTNSKTRVYIPSGLAADTISNWTLLYLAKTIA